MMLDWNVFKGKFGSWAHKIEPFFTTGLMDKIYEPIKADGKRGIKRSPLPANTFKAFEYCPLENLKCVFLGLAPYASFAKTIVSGEEKLIPVSDGLAFSCSVTGIEQPSLRVVWDAVFDDLQEEGKRYTNLAHWAQQGVLLLNLALTAKKDKPESDIKLWESFIHYLFDEILNVERGLPIVYFGKEAGRWEKQATPFIHYNKIVEHPAFAARQNRGMEHDKLFTWVNKILKEHDKEPINWICTQSEYDALTENLECPF